MLSDKCRTCGERHDLDVPMPPSGLTAADIQREINEGFMFRTNGARGGPGGLHLTRKGLARLLASVDSYLGR